MLPEQNINKSGNAAVEDEVVETIEVDLDEEVTVEDSTADVNVAAKLPPHGIYTCAWEANKKDNSIYASRTKSEPHRSFVGAALVGAIQDEEFEGFPVYVPHINSLQQRGKPTSDLHHFLNIVGNPAPNRTSIGELKLHTEATLEQKPLGMAELDWKASYKNEKGDWIDLATTMSKFPKHKDENGKWDGTYNQVIENPVTGEEVQAQLYVKKFLTQAEAVKAKARFA